MDQERKRRLFLSCVVLLTSLGLSLIAAEFVTRLFGFRPWHQRGSPNEPILMEYDPVLGWKSKEGSFSYRTAPEIDPIHITVVPESRRATESDETGRLDQRPKIVLVGGSWTYGWALSDEDTLGWKLQKLFKDREVLNYGVAGYGTYQSLLVLEQQLDKLSDVDIVVYGFLQHHEIRNVAAAEWLRGLSRRGGRGHVATPYVTLKQHRIQRQPPIRYPSWPGHGDSALIALIERDWVDLESRRRTRQSHEATEQLLLEMKILTEKHHSHFLVAMFREAAFDLEKHLRYIAFMKEHGIEYVDCGNVLDDSFRIIGDGHPNGAFNTLWSQQIAPSIENILKRDAVRKHLERS